MLVPKYELNAIILKPLFVLTLLKVNEMYFGKRLSRIPHSIAHDFSFSSYLIYCIFYFIFNEITMYINC